MTKPVVPQTTLQIPMPKGARTPPRTGSTDLVEAIGRGIAAADQEDYMEDCSRYDDRARGALAAIEAAGFAVVPKNAVIERLEAQWKSSMARGDKRGEDMAEGINLAIESIRAALAAAPKVTP